MTDERRVVRLRIDRDGGESVLTRLLRVGPVAVRMIEGRVSKDRAILLLELTGRPSDVHRAIRRYRRQGIRIDGTAEPLAAFGSS